MSIYIITTESFPNGMAATQRIRCYAKAISEENSCQVIVVNRLEDCRKPLGNTDTKGKIGNYTYKYVGGSTKIIKNKLRGQIVRLLDVFRLIVNLIRRLSSEDRILYYSYNITLLQLIARITHFKGAKIYYELCEHPSIQCLKCPSIHGDDVEWIRRNLSICDGIIVISSSLEKLVRQSFGNHMPIVKIPVLFETISEMNIDSKINNGVPYIMHTGSLTQRKDGIIGSLTAFGMVMSKNNYNIDYILTGNLDSSPDKAEILKVINRYQIQNKVKFVGFLSNNEMIKYQQNAYMTIVNKEDNLQNRYCFATKICEFLHAGCLLVTTDIGESSRFLTNEKDCLLFTPGNVNELSDILVDIFENRTKRDTIAEAGKELALQEFYCLKYSKILNDFMR